MYVQVKWGWQTKRRDIHNKRKTNTKSDNKIYNSIHRHFCKWCSFSQGGICDRSLEGTTIQLSETAEQIGESAVNLHAKKTATPPEV